MDFKVIGIKTIAYTSKKTGQPVEGVELHCLYNDNRVAGSAVDKIFLSSRYHDVSHLKLEDTIAVYYNRYGQVDHIETL